MGASQFSKAGTSLSMASYMLTLSGWLQCGGEKGAVAAAEPYLKLMGKNVVNCGQSGNGQAAKVCFSPLFHSLYITCHKEEAELHKLWLAMSVLGIVVLCYPMLAPEHCNTVLLAMIITPCCLQRVCVANVLDTCMLQHRCFRQA